MKTLIATSWNAVIGNRFNPLRRLFKRAETRRGRRAPAPYLSGASKCVWQMDREA